MKKMLMTATVPSMIGQFNMNNIDILQELGYEVHVGCNFKDYSYWDQARIAEFIKELKRKGVIYHQVDFARSPFKLSNTVKAYHQICKLIKTECFHFIHCHTPVAGAITRIAAHRFCTKVIYTAHGFHFYNGAPKLYWLVYYPIEKILSAYTNILITINKEDYQRAKFHFHAKRVEYIHGVGIDTAKFQRISQGDYLDIRAQMRSVLGCSDDDFVLVSVGELNENKNHSTIIRALAQLHDSQIRYFICGKGCLENQLRTLIGETDQNERVSLLGYRTDIREILYAADTFVFPSKREGLGLAAVEAMAAGLPLITSNKHGINDYSVEGKTGYLREPDDIFGFADAIAKMKQCDRVVFSTNNIKIAKRFDAHLIDRKMRRIYCSL